MTESSRQNEPPAAEPQKPWVEAEEKTRPATLFVQLVVIPLAVVAVCVGLGGLFMWLTSERKDFTDYVQALHASSGQQREQQAQYLLNYIQESKRWQGIFDVTAQISAGPDEFRLRHPEATAELVRIFEESGSQESKTRRYLALVLGLLGDKEAVAALRRGLNDPDADTVKNCIWALARLKDNESAPAIIELAHSDDPNVRLMAVYALGFLDHPQARDMLAAALKDPNEMVQWNAAFALANRGDKAAHGVLAGLLDKEYVDRQTEVTPANRSKYRTQAVVWLAKLDKEAARPLLEKVAANDADLQVRNAALEQLEDLRKK
jgi:HEAT repeat protein